MTLQWEHLIGREFSHGSSDCYGLVRDFFKDNFAIELLNVARADDWWDHGLNLYMDHYYSQGFRVVDDHHSQWQPADCFLMAIKSKVANHAAVLLPGGKILHHFYGRRSTVEDYRGLWRNTTVAVVRHKDVVLPQDETSANLMDYLPDAIRQKLSQQSA